MDRKMDYFDFDLTDNDGIGKNLSNFDLTARINEEMENPDLRSIDSDQPEADGLTAHQLFGFGDGLTYKLVVFFINITTFIYFFVDI